ncbi:hypothetical protein [Pseudoroseicyclus aestuarii]|uniref:DUF1127 domain-containing protein n=1 Tax=Pseudoroseicyclus aestuarii TaxID=1795041 RepID=A0A318SVM0_9RHOB|nr:hypothetical protein [Pseudoroseicyclus aestuarii]PYE85653.1 hypothetical protein DFP88_101322 [Pseudoroseicyclus aestuarii]
MMITLPHLNVGLCLTLARRPPRPPRRPRRRLRDIDPRLLEDLGVSRRDLEIATRLPYSHDTQTALQMLQRREGAGAEWQAFVRRSGR